MRWIEIYAFLLYIYSPSGWCADRIPKLKISAFSNFAASRSGSKFLLGTHENRVLYFLLFNLINYFKGVIVKFFIGLIFFLVSITAKAGVCNNGSLVGAYSFTAAGVGTSQIAIGKVQFNGKGVATFIGIEAYAGEPPYSVYGTVTYSVDASCIGYMTINWDGGGTTEIGLILNEMDNIPATRVAYGASVLYYYSGEIATGSLKRVVGKFN